MKAEFIQTWKDLFLYATDCGHRLTIHNREWRNASMVDIKVYKNGLPVGKEICGVSLDAPAAAAKAVLDVIHGRSLHNEIADNLNQGRAYSLTTIDNYGDKMHHFIQKVPALDGDMFIIYQSDGSAPQYRQMPVDDIIEGMKKLSGDELTEWTML